MSYQNQKYQNEKKSVIVTPPDKTLIITAVFLVIVGIMFVFSAGSARAIAEGASPLFYLVRHLIWLVLGCASCVFLSNFDYHKLRRWAIPFAFMIVVLLILTKFTSLGVSVNGARRWLGFGFFQFQPSEFSKLALVLCLADTFSVGTKLLDKSKIPYYVLFGAMIVLILLQPNLSMVALLCFCAMFMYYCAGGQLSVILGAFAFSIPMLFLVLLKDYQRQRLLVWLDPTKDPQNAGYNIIQSLIAFSGGSFFGLGYGNSKQKLSWLPEGHTDFIFSVIAEEFGFIGCLFVIGFFFVFIRRGLIIASRCPDNFGRLLALGVTISIGMQAFINMGVASGFLPASGVPLPFISYGGSSLFISLSMLGILLNISKKKVQRIIPRRFSYE